jgi:hypothetical protein
MKPEDLQDNDVIEYLIYYQPRDNKHYRLNNVKYAGLNYQGSLICCNIDSKSTHTELDENMNDVQTCDMDWSWLYIIPQYVTDIKKG